MIPGASDHDHASAAVRFIVGIGGMAVCLFGVYLAYEAIRLWSEPSAKRIRRICIALAFVCYIQLEIPGLSDGASSAIVYIAAGALYWITCPRLIGWSGETEALQKGRGIKVFAVLLLWHLLPGRSLLGEPRDWSVSPPFVLALLAILLACCVAAYKLLTRWMIQWRSNGSTLVPALCIALAMSGIIAIGDRSLGYLFPDPTISGPVSDWSKASAARKHFKRGNEWKEKGELDKAIGDFNEAIKLYPFPEAHYNLGNALRDQGKLDEAIAEYREAIRLRPDYPSVHLVPEAHYNLGNALRDQGKLDEAIAEYREAIRLRPDYPSAHLGLGNALRDQGKPE